MGFYKRFMFVQVARCAVMCNVVQWWTLAFLTYTIILLYYWPFDLYVMLFATWGGARSSFAPQKFHLSI